jgi:serine phosphatase RsbU (regulator of sigma subunit)
MIAELESLYNDLEQKVRDRTAEIMAQKEEIETQRDSIEVQKNMLEGAYQEITEQKKHITDSIVYAKRIQTSILPPDEQIRRLLRDSFVLYRPKDIVSGDFYWLTEKDNWVMIAAVDCTGHGVPGAFMSIVGHNNLNYAVNVKGARIAGDILDQLNLGVIETLRQQSGDGTIRDGMDLALCCFDFDNKKLFYAGANNPLVLIRNNEAIQFEPTRAPIGAYEGAEGVLFQNNEITFENGDCFYIFSDGYADQFGGPRNKKFFKSRLIELLTSISQLPMEAQKAQLEKSFDEWRGAQEQVDDILVIGVKVV